LRRIWRAARHIAALVRLTSFVVRRRPDVVFWHPLRFPIDAMCVLLVSRLSSASMATILHEPRPLTEKLGSSELYQTSPVVHRALARAIRRMDVIFVLSDTNRDYVQRTWSPSAAVTVIPHGNEDVFLSQGSVPPAEDTPPHILFFGTWTQHKGIDTLLDAFAAVRAAVPEARLTIAGAVANVDFAQIESRAREVGAVTLRPGYVPMAEVADLMGSHRVLAVPYVRANQSGVVHLGQTFGRPSVATRVGDIPDVVVDGQTGVLIEPGDPDELAAALIRMLRHPEEAGRMGRAAAAQVKVVGSWDGIADKVHAALTHNPSSSTVGRRRRDTDAQTS